MEKSAKFEPIFWGTFILIASQILTFYVAFREKDFVEAYQIASPRISIHIPMVYFFGAAILLGLIVFLVPVSKLRIGLKITFTFLFAWGTFIALGLSLPTIMAALVSVAAGLTWLLAPRVWLHNLLMILTLVSVGSVFGFLLSPWTAMSFMLVISIYDILAVRFGYMLWMVKRLSESETLPAFVIPRKVSSWNLNLKQAGFRSLLENGAAEREFSILGGGDIGFPLLLMVSVFFAYGFRSSLIVGVFSLLGLVCAYLIQLQFLRGKPMPALPPIAFVSLIGFVIVYLIQN